MAITTRAYRLAVDAAWQALHTPQEGDPMQGTATATGAGAVAVGAEGAVGVGGAVGDSASKQSSTVTGKGDLEGVRALKKKIASTSTSTSTSATSSDLFNGVDDALMRDLKQVFARGQDQDYDGLSAGTTHTHTTHTHTHSHSHSHSKKQRLNMYISFGTTATTFI